MRNLLSKLDAKSVLINVLLALTFVGLTYFYLHPGSEAMIDGRTDLMMGDGTDTASIPHAYDLILDSWNRHPARLFYGAVYVDGGDPDHGAAFWSPWNERWLVVIGSWFLPVEQLYTWNVFAILLLNGLCMFLLGRYLGWSRTLSFGMSMAWAFMAYTRARAKVHGALAGIYHLPLIFLGLFLVVRGRTRRSLVLAALSFLLAGTVAHYYLVISICLSPLFVVFVLLQPEFRQDRKRVSKRFVVALLPLMVFLAFNRLVPVPSDAKMTSEWLMEKEVSMDFLAPSFLRAFSARPIDFLTGDISLNAIGEPTKTSDLNPLRESINEHVIATMTEGNPHERTNGIRWSILGLGIGLFVWGMARRARLDAQLKTSLPFFAVFGFICLWMSLSPDVPFDNMGLSHWVNVAFSKIRVPSRSGIGLAFALMMIIGLMVSSSMTGRLGKALLLPGLFPLLMLIDYWPAQAMPTSPIAPAYTHLNREHGHCGPGLFFPFVSTMSNQVILYQMAQRLRGSDCSLLNSTRELGEMQFLINMFPPTPQFMQSLGPDDQPRVNLRRLAECVPLTWIAFHQATPPPWAARVCSELGWKLFEDGTCIAPDRGRSLERQPSKCF